MEKLDLKKFKNFKSNISERYGGRKDVETYISAGKGKSCDIHHDTNDNGEIDNGETFTIVKC